MHLCASQVRLKFGVDLEVYRTHLTHHCPWSLPYVVKDLELITLYSQIVVGYIFTLVLHKMSCSPD